MYSKEEEPEPIVTDSSRKCQRKRGRRGRRRKYVRNNTNDECRKAEGDETAKELRASLPTTMSSHASSSRSDDETQDWLMLSTLLTRWCCVCSVQFGSPKMVTTMIRQVITERQNEMDAIRRKNGIFIRTNNFALITTIEKLQCLQ